MLIGPYIDVLGPNTTKKIGLIYSIHSQSAGINGIYKQFGPMFYLSLPPGPQKNWVVCGLSIGFWGKEVSYTFTFNLIKFWRFIIIDGEFYRFGPFELSVLKKQKPVRGL